MDQVLDLLGGLPRVALSPSHLLNGEVTTPYGQDPSHEGIEASWRDRAGDRPALRVDHKPALDDPADREAAEVNRRAVPQAASRVVKDRTVGNGVAGRSVSGSVGVVIERKNGSRRAR